VLIPVLHRYSVYKMLVYGAIISAISLWILSIPSIGNTTYIISIIALTVLTIGEVIWSPRLNEYTAAIAPEGQEGTYLGLSMVPYFLAKTVVGLASGHMLSRWVPVDIGDKLRAGTVAFWDSPSGLWIILGTFVLSSVLALVGAGGILAYLPFNGVEFGFIGMGLLLYSAYAIIRKIQAPLVCEE